MGEDAQVEMGRTPQHKWTNRNGPVRLQCGTPGDREEESWKTFLEVFKELIGGQWTCEAQIRSLWSNIQRDSNKR